MDSEGPLIASSDEESHINSTASAIDHFWAHVQFQSMLWRLLGHALDLSNPESDTLVEEALRLLVSALNCTSAFMPAFQVIFRAVLPCTP